MTREVASLDYEAYREMAEERIAAILADCVDRHDLLAAAAEHRVGRVPRGEPGVVVAVAAGTPRGSLRRRPRGDRPDQGRGADLEARARRAGQGAWVEGTAAPEPEARRA